MRLVLCDNNRILCEALGAALEARGHQVQAITGEAAEAVAAVAAHEPDVCLLDVCSPGPVDGLAAAQAIRRDHAGTAVLVLSGVTDPAVRSAIRKMGLAGLLFKDRSVDQIIDALGVITAGGVVFDPMLPQVRGGRATSHQRQRALYFLTQREREVLRRIVAGQSTPQMAREMEIATSTLRSYVKNLLVKLGAHSRLQAAALATREDLFGDAESA